MFGTGRRSEGKANVCLSYCANVLKEILESVSPLLLPSCEVVRGPESEIRILSGCLLCSTTKKQRCGWMLNTVNIKTCKKYLVLQNSLCHFILRKDRLQARWILSQTFRCNAGSGTFLPSSECALYCSMIKTLASTCYISDVFCPCNHDNQPHPIPYCDSRSNEALQGARWKSLLGWWMWPGISIVATFFLNQHPLESTYVSDSCSCRGYTFCAITEIE